MKFKLKKLALALPLTALTLSAYAAVNTQGIEQATNNTKPYEYQLKQKQAVAAFGEQYFVLLKDEPLSLYQGNVKGFKATNIAASNGLNVTDNGKLDVNSNASMAYSSYLDGRQSQAFVNIEKHLQRSVNQVTKLSIALNALVLDLDEQEAKALLKLDGVMSVQAVEWKQLDTDVGPAHIGAPIVWDDPTLAGASMGEGLVVGIIDTGIASYKKKFTTYSWSASPTEADFNPSFADIGGDGYDHTNPNGSGVYFGDCIENAFWCNDKLIGVVSFQGARTLMVSSTDLRFDTGQDDQGHGTHVASTAAGNILKDLPYSVNLLLDPTGYAPYQTIDTDFNVNISGVAPHANIVSYRVCIPTYGCNGLATIQALEHAITNNVDVINYSVGGAPTSPWYSADSLAFLAAREAGIYVAVSAGNNGNAGASTVGGPGNSPWLTTVAAFSHGRSFTDDKTAVFSGGDTQLPDMVGKAITLGLETPTPIVYAGDVENPTYPERVGGVGMCYKFSLPATYLEESIEGKVVVCNRGGEYNDKPLSRVSKSVAAKYRKAAGLILINSDENVDTIVADFHDVPTVHLSKADGDALLAWLETGTDHMVSIIGDSVMGLDMGKADIAGSFTSRGPDFIHKDYMVPDVGGPGVAIYASNIGTNMHATSITGAAKIPGDYMQISGTSMSSPHMAGAFILMKAAHPEWTPAEAQSAMMSTAFTDVKEKVYIINEAGNDYERDEFGNPEFDLVRSNHHISGNGSARINDAIAAGLVMNETKAGYLAANPFANEWEQAEIEGWHGEPHQLNMPSFSKGDCLIECTWTRTFTPTKSTSWAITFEHYNEGFTITSNMSGFTGTVGTDVVIEFTAEANSALVDEWVDGRVILTPSDSSMPVQTLPMTVNFIAGYAPDLVEIDATRNNDSVPVKGIITIGTDNLQVEKSGLAKATIHEFDLMRDATNAYVMDNQSQMNESIHAIPLNIQADTKRLVIQVLDTSSPDIDIFVGIDVDLSGDPTGFNELNYIRYSSATATAIEKIDVIDPINDTYWLLVHNWAAGPAAVQDGEMVCDAGQLADEGLVCVDAQIKDSVKIAVTQVTYDDDSMTIDTPTSVAAREELDARVSFSTEASQDDILHGVFWLGTNQNLSRNIGAVKVDMRRLKDDVQVSDASVNGDVITTDITLGANNSGEEKTYTFEMPIAEGMTVTSVMASQSDTNSSMETAFNDVDFIFESGVLNWSKVQAIGATSVDYSVVLNASVATGMLDITPVINSGVSTSDVVETFASASGMPLFYEGRPVFSAQASAAHVKKGDTVTITANVEDAVINGAEIGYIWQQISGPDVSIMGSGTNTISFKAGDGGALVFSLVGTNGSRNSLPVEVEVNVESPKKSGGSTGGLFIMLLSGLFMLRRMNAKTKRLAKS